MLKITLISHTPDPEVVCATAAHTCVSADDAADFAKFLATKHPKHANKILAKVLGYGHESVLEHASFTFAVSGVSRSLSHQLVRFRLASFSQRSQRYVKLEPGEMPHVIPPSIAANIHTLELFEEFMIEAAELYQVLLNFGVPAEDARYVLPNATETEQVMTMNARELRHALSLRCCTHAQWEIRDMFNQVLRLVKPVFPVAFADAGAPCVRGACPEGSRGCNKQSA